MVQHARVVVGATGSYHGTIHKSFYCCYFAFQYIQNVIEQLWVK